MTDARVEAGRDRASSSGQPSVENGHSPELNQVSKMSGSWVSSAAGRPQASQAPGPAVAGLTVTWPSGQYQAGIRWPHQSWRLTFQSRISVSQCSQTLSKRSGRMSVRFERVAARAASARGAVRTNHCVLRRGSTTSSVRWQRPRIISWAAAAHEVAGRLQVGEDLLAGLVPVEARVATAGRRRSGRRRPARR